MDRGVAWMRRGDELNSAIRELSSPTRACRQCGATIYGYSHMILESAKDFSQHWRRTLAGVTHESPKRTTIKQTANGGGEMERTGCQ